MRANGFSLIELMVALVISAILALVAYPVYASYRVGANRQAAEATLLHIASQMEVYFAGAGTYEGVTLKDLGVMSAGNLPYVFSVIAANATHYVLQAIPRAQQRVQDQACGVLSLSEDNLRGANGVRGAEQCW